MKNKHVKLYEGGGFDPLKGLNVAQVEYDKKRERNKNICDPNHDEYNEDECKDLQAWEMKKKLCGKKYTTGGTKKITNVPFSGEYEKCLKENSIKDFNMKTKHVKLYEDYSMEIRALRIYESTMKKINASRRLNEQDENEDEFEEWLYTDDPLNAAERRAQGQGKQILNKRQMAVMYLAAKGDDDHGDITEYIKIIPGLHNYDFDMPKSHVIGAIADAFGIDKDRTFDLTLRKFYNHITGKVEDPEVIAKHADYEKLRNNYYRFIEYGDSPNDLALLLADAVQEVSADQRQQRVDDIETRRETTNQQANQRRTEVAAEHKQLAEEIHELVSQMKKGNVPLDMYSRMILNRKSEEIKHLTKREIYEIYARWLTKNEMNPKFYITRPS